MNELNLLMKIDTKNMDEINKWTIFQREVIWSTEKISFSKRMTSLRSGIWRPKTVYNRFWYLKAVENWNVCFDRQPLFEFIWLSLFTHGNEVK